DSLNVGSGVIPNNFPVLEGETSNTPRFKRILEYSKTNGIKKIVFIKDMVLEETLEINQQYLTLYSQPKNHIMLNIKAADNFVGESLIHVKQPGVSFQGISFQGDNNGELTTSTLVRLLYDFNQPDLDSYIKRCNIQRFKIGIL